MITTTAPHPPPRVLPSPSSRDLNANKAAALGAWRARPADAPCRPSIPSLEGRWGWVYIHPSLLRRPQHIPSLPSAPHPRPGADAAARSENRPAQWCPHPQLLPGSVSRGSRLGGGWRSAGPRQSAPNPRPPEARVARRALPRLQGERSCQGLCGPARVGSLAFQDNPPPQRSSGRAGGRGREIRSHNIGLSPSPPQTFRRGWRSRGQSGGLERILAADPTARGTPASLGPAPPDQSAPPDAMAAGTVRPARETPPGSPRGAQEGSQTDSCPRCYPSLRPETLSLARAAAPDRGGGQSGGPRAPALPPRVTLASLTSSSRLESLGAALAFGSDHGPPLPARHRPPARARPPARPPPLSPLPPPHGPGSARRPWVRAPRATAPGAGSFSSAAAALRPLPPDVRRGGGCRAEAGGGTRRPAPEGAATRRDLPAPPVPRLRPPTPDPPRAPPPRASEWRSAPPRREVGRGRNSGHCLGGDRTHLVFLKCTLRPTWERAPGFRYGAEGSPRCSYRNEREQATSERVSEGGVQGKPRLLFWADQSGLSFGPQFRFVSWSQGPLALAVRLEQVLPARKTH